MSSSPYLIVGAILYIYTTVQIIHTSTPNRRVSNRQSLPEVPFPLPFSSRRKANQPVYAVATPSACSIPFSFSLSPASALRSAKVLVGRQFLLFLAPVSPVTSA